MIQMKADYPTTLKIMTAQDMVGDAADVVEVTVTVIVTGIMVDVAVAVSLEVVQIQWETPTPLRVTLTPSRLMAILMTMNSFQLIT